MADLASNKRIAKNSLFLYIRMIVIMLITLYTSRIVLEELGIDDYGVYNVVGGVVAMFSFLNSSMVSATQRYLNYEMGNGGDDSPELRKIFSTSLTIHLLIACAIVLLAETLGLWFVNHELVIPEASRFGANVVYQCAIASFVVNILRVPFNASIIAHERMNLFAILSLAEAVLLLGATYLLMLVAAHKLAWYGFFRFVLVLIIGMCFMIICLGKFKECTLRCNFIKSLFKEMIGFAGWNMFGSVAWLIRNQGMGIVLNVFFGPAINAAKGISDQVSHAVSSVTNNFQTALNPQITKNYAASNLTEMQLLAFRGIKFSCMLIWMMALPIRVNVNTILSIWLTEVPDYAALFVVLIMIDVFASSLFGSPLMTSLSATGKIRNYQIVVSLVLLLILPASYIALKLGMPPESIFYLNILFNLLSGLTRFGFCKRQIGYSWHQFVQYVLLPLCSVLALSTIIPLAFKFFVFDHNGLGKIPVLILLLVISFTSVVAMSWMIGLSKGERTTISQLVRAKLHH